MDPFNSREERETELVAEWCRLARLMVMAHRARMDFDDTKLDRVARYCLLKTFLNDSVIRELSLQGDTDSAYDLWVAQRQRYAVLLAEFTKDVMDVHRNRVQHRVASLSWTDYRATVRSMIRIRFTIFELRVAFRLHGFGFSAGQYLATRACSHIRSCFPPAKIVPIRFNV